MNPDNYGSLKACQRLAAAGIVLETEKVWMLFGETWVLRDRIAAGMPLHLSDRCIPAPSMAEVWRELPEKTKIKKYNGVSWAWNDELECDAERDNPTDALIDLLIFVHKDEKK